MVIKYINNLNNRIQKFEKKGMYTKIKNRCVLTGRSNSTYAKYKLSRISLKNLCNNGKIPGIFKYSW